MTKYEFSIACCARWEEDSIVEWLNYYKYIGFDHCFLYCNDDTPEPLFEAVYPFISTGFVDFHFHPLQGQQEVSFTHCVQSYLSDTKWIAFVDADEFLLLRHYDSIGEFLGAFTQCPDAVHFNTLNAGHNGHVDRPSGSVIQNFPLRAPAVEAFTKCIVRTGSINRGKLDNGWGNAWWHNISAITDDHARVINVLGDDMFKYYTGGIQDNWRLMSTPLFHERVINTAALYHCGMKSEGDMLRRFQRGLAGVYGGQQAWKELHDQGRVAVLAYLNQYNKVHEPRLLEIRSKMLSTASVIQLAPRRPSANIAPQGSATQSSICAASKSQVVSEDASNVIDNKPSGSNHHCTDVEDNPWWQVVFQEAIKISEIWIYNRLDGARDRFRNFRLYGKRDDIWHLLFEKNDNIPFGGVDGRMFRYSLSGSFAGIRIEGIGVGLIDLDQVEIFQ